MHAARRLRVAPLAALGEEALLHAARTLAPSRAPVRPGDAVGDGLVVVAVEPAPGAAFTQATEVELSPAPRAHDAPRVELAVLVDASESMGLPWDERHTRLEAALAAARSFLAAPGDAVVAASIHQYAREARLVAGPAAPAELRLPAAPTPKGPSDTAGALDAALALLASRSRAGVAQAVLLLTDGVGSVEALQAAGERAGRLRVPVHMLVFAPEVDEAFDALARTTGGSVQQAAHPLTIEFVHQPGG